jgi:hypothetical protein
VFTAVSIAGILLAIADEVMPPSGSEADLGPNVAAVVFVWTLGLLALIAATDAALHSAFRAIRSRFVNPS